jgi:hypothetical protein
MNGFEVGGIGQVAVDCALEHWIEALKFEYASVASFARFAIDLMTVQAPLELVQRAQQCSIEEIDHVKISALVVNKILEAQGAKDKFVTLGRFPKHQAHFDGDFVRLCKAVVFEGCINETVAAAHLLHASILCTNDSLKQILYHIAEQEWGHALFAFDCFHWMMSQLDLETRKLIQVEIENNLKEEVAKAKNMTKAQISIHQLGVLSDSKERFVRTQVIHKVLIPELSFGAQRFKHSFHELQNTLSFDL